MKSMRRYFSLTCLTLLLAAPCAAQLPGHRIEIAGGWYGEALPRGEFAVAIRGAGVILTTYGTVSSPESGDGVLYLRLSPDGRSFAGQSHAGLGSWAYNGSWRLDSNPAFGVSGLIYDSTGVLRFAVPGVTGSQGFRYVEDGTGRLVTGDETYADPARRIWEYTTHGDVTVGQGETGCIALRLQDRRLIEPGDCRFVRFNRAGDMLAITMVKLLENKTVILWLDASELRFYPPESPLPPPPPPAPPTPMLGISDAQFETLKRVRAKYPTPLTDIRHQLGAILNEVAFVEHLGLESKPDDNSAIQPVTGTRIGKDILRFIDAAGNHTGQDVLASTGTGEATPVRGTIGPADKGRYVRPVDPGSVNPPPPPPPSDELERLRAQVIILQAQATTLRQQLAQAVLDKQNAQTGWDAAVVQIAELMSQLGEARQQLAAAKARIMELENKPPPSCEAKVPGWLRALGVRIGCTVRQP